MITLTDDATEQLDVAANKLPSYSLPASSNWVRFFVTDFWGRNYFNFKGRASRKEYWAGLVLGYVYSIVIFLLIYFGGKIVFGLSSHNAQDNLMHQICIFLANAEMPDRFSGHFQTLLNMVQAKLA